MKTGTFSYFWNKLTKFVQTLYVLTISAYISVENFMKVSSDLAKQIIFRRSGQLTLLKCADNNTFKNIFFFFSLLSSFQLLYLSWLFSLLLLLSSLPSSLHHHPHHHHPTRNLHSILNRIHEIEM